MSLRMFFEYPWLWSGRLFGATGRPWDSEQKTVLCCPLSLLMAVNMIPNMYVTFEKIWHAPLLTVDRRAELPSAQLYIRICAES